MKTRTKLILPITLLGLIVFGATAALITALLIENESEWYNKNFEKVEIKNPDFIKGADISSYAEVIEQATYNEGKYKNYLDLTATDQEIYTNYDGINKNLFEILANNGVNSLRLRVWNDPYDAEGNSYGGGHNDIETNIWIANQAKKFGFTDFLLDFHYSDFWADPAKQYLPKAWQNLSDSQVRNAAQTYTYNALKKFYDETKLVPKIVQLGNEITYGSFWREQADSSSSKESFIRTSGFLNAAARGLKEFESYVSAKETTTQDVIAAIHIDGTPSVDRFVSIVHDYLYAGGCVSWVEEVGITHYQNWNGNNVKLFNLMKKLKAKFNLNSFVSEAATPYTWGESDYTGDITGSQNKEYEKEYHTSNQMHTKLLTSLMETTSKALPNAKTGFYWWEPAWLMGGKTGWATPAGIKYAEPEDLEKQASFLTGNSWWNRGWFNFDGQVLPILKAVKAYKRVYESTEVIDINALETNFYYPTFNSDVIFKKAPLVDTKNLLVDAEDLNARIKQDYFVLNSSTNLEQDLIKKFNEVNDSIYTSQISFSNLQYDEVAQTGTIDLKLSAKNFYYQSDFQSKTIYFAVQPLKNEYLDFTEDFTIEVEGQDWYNGLNWGFAGSEVNSTHEAQIKTVTDKLTTTITAEFKKDYWYTVFREDSGVIAYWDKYNNLNRYYAAYLAIDPAGYDIINYDNSVNYDTLQAVTAWQDTLTPGVHDLLIYYTKSVDFNNYGIENWRNIKTVAVKYRVNAS
ncbi:hypothetical protein SCLARK_00747 [Spiroplasma clarkii]|uniref:Arabinogalactan endo-beta-1,4-galactanase n=1 Tax=Spiroplasma clarkii TaxID=2139 RepID=A0A1Y0L050_9MOLU|nr:glycosyl hydrolase 53 family protein [Spiroplasma clarkii]ARU91394.1 hypothetical protein SCLARK_00747 [Spiroplasma clarkii]ATX70808.1 arabinogalactan endo-1,4-beta-galactosidase [Spiroplasma clarkii]